MINNKVAVELFSGSCVVADTLRADGWDVLTIDINSDYGADVSTDIAALTISDLPKKFRRPFFVWASPPCTTFSVLQCGHNWSYVNGYPMAKNPRAAVGVYLVYKTLCLINDLQPVYWCVENPVGMLRKMPFMKALHKKTVTYCKYGDTVMKPTDVWTNMYHWNPRPMCANGDKCHEASPRGSGGGIKAKDSAFDRAKVPVELINELIDYMNKGAVVQNKLLLQERGR